MAAPPIRPFGRAFTWRTCWSIPPSCWAPRGGSRFIYATPDAAQTRDWAAGFETGYGVGVGVERVGDFDACQPVAPTTMELIVDDLANIDFVNWT